MLSDRIVENEIISFKKKKLNGNLLMALMRASGPSSRKIMGGCLVPSHWIKVN
jgi:hypothetical protein